MSQSEIDPVGSMDRGLDVRAVCEAIALAAAEAVTSEDYLSYATVLDIHLGNPERYDYAERERVLEALKVALTSYPMLSKEIGWDLPALILPYIDSSYDFRQDLVLAPCVRRVTDIFNLISHDGTPKELYLKALEAMVQLKREPGHTSCCVIDRENPEADQYRREKFLGIKFHLLYKLVTVSNGKITTQYPSRFLATTVTGLLSLLQSLVRSKSAFQTLCIVLRRIYTMIRDYVPNESPLPLDEKERVVIRTILRNTLTHAVSITSSRMSIRWAVRNSREIQYGVFDLPLEDRRLVDDVDSTQSQMVDIMMRCSQLMLSIDMEPQDTLNYLISLPFESFESQFEGEDEEVEGDTDDNDDNDDNEDRNLPVSLSFDLNTPNLDGLMVLLAEHLYDDHPQKLTISLDDWVNLAIKYAMSRGRVPSVISDAIVFGSHYWLHLAENTASPNDLLFDTVPKEKLFHYLQVLTVFFVAAPLEPVVTATVDNARKPEPSSSEEEKTPTVEATSTGVTFRRVILDLIVRVLRQRRSSDAWEWLLDSVTQCPWSFGRSQLIGVLKQLTRVDREILMVPLLEEKEDEQIVESLTTAVDGTSLEEVSSPPVVVDSGPLPPPPPPPPPLPPRVINQPLVASKIKKVAYRPQVGQSVMPHVILDHTKIMTLAEVIVDCVKSTFIKDEEESITEINGEELPILLTWLNFLIGVVDSTNSNHFLGVIEAVKQGLKDAREEDEEAAVSLRSQQLDLVSFTFDRLVSRMDELK